MRDFLNSMVRSFGEVLTDEPEVVRHDLQKRISSITLTPAVDERGHHYKVTGDVELFSVPEGAVQDNPVELVDLHYNMPISIEVMTHRGRQKRLKANAA